MKILHLSDTHGFHRQLKYLPEADVIVHSGDFTMSGSYDDGEAFIRWFGSLLYRHKIFIAGNHDYYLYEESIVRIDPTIHYLKNSGAEIDGVKFYGVPMFMEDCFSDSQNLLYQKIPDSTDVLITHPSAFLISDIPIKARRH